ncbi:agmatinase [Enterococcus sp. AZ150]|uniref:Agmatinase n=1 Tax=Enterococcus sulfureus ATCC 49903 TaxID=1140003 RepID=S0NWR8_9ENTE|nr:agmatinase [Enterococcus sulfureus]EOT46666.1 agmatinase [Enterococcus sulfureus ATCC 49903]EOT86022.1 agmatinase [Enterococcus sulfureus ATCC 49903]
MKPNIETFLACDASFEDATTVLFGAPFDSTTSFRPGTRFASRAIRADSFGLETYSPYQDKDLEDLAIFDAGDLELSFGRVDLALKDIKQQTATILAAKKRPFMIGGEHLVTLGAFEAIFEQYPDIHVIQFDAHTDLRDTYLDAKLSHATVIRRVHDLIGDDKIYQFGIRSGERAEFKFAKEHTYLQKFDFTGLTEVVATLKEKKVPVYFTLDLDVLDPAAFPGTGTPEAGGVMFPELLQAILEISALPIVGIDVNELSPQYDLSGASTALAGKIIREILLATN